MFSKNQKIILVCAAASFVLTLISYLWLDLTWLFLLCLILHSICLILFSFLSYRMVLQNPQEVKDLTERIQNIKEKWRNESALQKEEISNKEAEINSLKKDIMSQSQKIGEYSDEISELIQQISSLKDSVSQPKEDKDVDITSVLPANLLSPSDSLTIDIISVAKNVADSFRDIAKNAGVTITISAQDEALLVKADRNLIQTLFRNIVDNSIKYMNKMGSLVITISSISDDIFVVCKDNGNGLSEDETPHIFELNFQGSNRISGNGLGLFQAKAIVEYYGGNIYARSYIGGGMGIYIQLPGTQS